MRAARDLLRRRLFFVRKRGELFSHVRTTLHQGNLPTPSGQLLYLCNRAKVPDAFNDPMVRARVNVTEDGSQLRNELTPGARYRQISTEFDVETTISPRGYRLPYDGPRSEILFVGDSFTFGIGLADEETFASIYCQSRAVTCANLGRPGSGTVRQIDRLANALSRGYRPREVKLFILAMTSSIFPGNDLSDLWEYANRARLTASAAGSAERQSEGADRGGGGRRWAVDRALSDSWVGLVLSYRGQITRVSNLARVAKLYWGPLLLSRIVPGFDRERLQESLRLLEQEIARLESLGAEAGFEYQVYLIHPVQDLINGTHGSTYDRLSSVAVPNLVSTAHLFLEAPADFYFPFDGHLNGRGARRVAEFLLEADGGPSP